MKHKEPLSAFIVPLIFGLTMVTGIMLYIILPTEARKTVVIATEDTTVEEELTEAETEPETAEIESEEENEQETSEEVSHEVLDDEPTASVPSGVVVETLAQNDAAGSVRFYGIWSGAYWHFTPEQIDAQWSGLKPSKPALPTGTTRAWQAYLYERLSSIGAEWFYPYAVAQAMQESGFNPLNNVGRTQISWLNGMATYDCGLFSFKDIYWNPTYGDICDYHANINAYITRVSPYLAGGEANVKLAIAQHYDAYHYSEKYVQDVLGRLNELWEVE